MKLRIKVENLSKYYQRGSIGFGTLRNDLNRAWEALRKQHPEEPSHLDTQSFWALKNLNLIAEEGEVLGVIGDNGSGKSTLLKIISRITSPTEGSVYLRGSVGSMLEVGTGFHPELTGRDNIFLNGAVLGMKQREIASKLEQITEFADIATALDTPVKRYSSGMTVRLAFAVAAHLDTNILIVDEVLSIADINFQEKCIDKIKAGARDGKTILFVSHNMSVIEQICDRVLVLEEGQTVYDGDVSEGLDIYSRKSVPANAGISERLP